MLRQEFAFLLSIADKNKLLNLLMFSYREKYVKIMENFLCDQSQFQKMAVKNHHFLNFLISQERPID